MAAYGQYGYTVNGRRIILTETAAKDVCMLTHNGNELKNGGIALISGVSDEGGHAWVLDGTGSIEYECWTYYSYNPITGQYGSCDHNKYVSQYVHCNWGWGGQDNGYFHEGVYDTSKGVENLTRTNYNSKIKGYVYK